MGSAGIEVEEHYKREGRDLVTFLFDSRFLNDNLAKESIDALEEYLGFIFQSKCKSAAKAAVLLERVRLRKETL